MFIVAFATKSEETTRHASDEVQVNVTLSLFVILLEWNYLKNKD